MQQVIIKICRELPQSVAKLKQPNYKDIKQSLEREIKEKKEITRQLSVLVTQNVLDEETANLRRYKLQTEISQLENKRDRLPPENLNAIASTVSLPQFWYDLSEAERRFYFREFIKQIEVIRLENNNWDLKLIFIF